MSKLVVYRASAGSGKTFRLAAEYIKQLITNPDSYKRILAVTFTNKATAEMKGRILEELFSIANGYKTTMGDKISAELNIPVQTMQQRAKSALSLILHDYSRFSISTIDSFVQRVIQSLLWEIGQQGGVDIELDTTPVLEHASDNLIDSASQIDELMSWLSSMGESLMDDGKSWDVRRKLMELGKQIFSEKFRLMSREDVDKFTDKERVHKLKVELINLTKSITAQINNLAEKALQELQKRGIEQSLFVYGQTGIIGYFNKFATFQENDKEIPDYTKVRIQNALNDSSGEEWVTKTVFKDNSTYPSISVAVQEILHPALLQIVETIEQKSFHFNSARLILKNLENLALIGDLWNKVRELSREEGFLLLSDSNHLLKEFVKESDAPFVYEKVGTRYDTFMIDEFQDTSEVQWHNFRPLIENSLSQDCFSMIVGDVKQSIYRWRNGDWSILATGVEHDFRHYGIEKHSLEVNYRSLPEIITFNNTFFEKAMVIASNSIDENSSEPIVQSFKEQISKAYEDVSQKSSSTSNQQSGYVECRFAKNEKDRKYDAFLSKEIPDLVENIRQNHKLGSIAILVRNQKDGQKIASMFLEYNRSQPNREKHITFVSQDGLLLNASSIVRLTIAAFQIVQDSTNEIAKRILAKEMVAVNGKEEENWHNYFLESFVIDEVEWLSTLCTRPLQEVFEAIANKYKLYDVEGELPHLAELHEHILSISRKGGGDLNRFLNWWEEKSTNLSLSVPESTEAISIITIHKSKGLQFPVVLIPYAGWEFRPRSSSPLLWVKSDEEPFNLLPKYPISATTDARKSLFAADYLEEKMKELVDNLNLLYVAFTRAEKELYIFAQIGTTEKEKSSISNTSKLIYPVIKQIANTNDQNENFDELGQFEKYTFGKPYLSTKEDKEKRVDTKGWKMDHYPVGQNFRGIKLKIESEEFFQTDTSDRLSTLEHGVIMHNLFASINTIDDIDKAIQKLQTEGLVDSLQADLLTVKVKEILGNEPAKQWFTGEWEIKRESAIITPDGKNYRPDRVMIQGNNAIVVDYKFGAELPSHQSQVRNYMNLCKEMGYTNTQGFIWYVDENRFIQL